jgi:hypothetical protein
MKTILMTIAMSMTLSWTAQADDRVLPAQADDMARAEANLGAAAKDKRKNKSDDEKSKTRKDNFGAIVSKEAKILKDADVDTRKGFGQSIAEQRRNDHSQNAGSSNSGSATAGAGAPSDPLSHVPSQGSASSGAGRPASPGNGHGH